MEEIERSLNEAEEDAFAASDILIGLTTQFGSDELLLRYIAECNVARQQISVYRNRVAAALRELSPTAVIELQLLAVQVRELKDDCRRLIQVAEELRRG